MAMSIREREQRTISGGLVLAIVVPALLGAVGGVIGTAVLIGVAQAAGRNGPSVWWPIGLSLTVVADIVVLCGLFTVGPNEAKVLQLFGRYVGTVRESGLRWACPFYSKHAVSVRVRNFESAKLKVNDFDGNPIEIAAVVVWRVTDTAEACFHVDDYDNFVHVQSEAALRNLATRHPYDAHNEGQVSLRGNTAAVAEQLRVEVQDRLHDAGVEVLQARISHLAYAQEIAAAMLRRQQASAVVAARQKIVEGAVGMVETALQMLSKQKIVELDEERKAAMVSNLLVVLCGERDAQPVVNTGTLYT